MQKKIRLKYVYILIMMALVCSCRTHQKHVNIHYTHQEELTIEKTEVEEKLKGEEKKVLEEAFEWLDTPYEYGRQDKGKATDCSGMVMCVYETAIDCKLPRNSARQAEFCEDIEHKEIKPGDLVFFITNKGSKINHVGIMIDTEKFIHASSHGVMVSSMLSDYYKTHWKKYGRVPCMKH